MTSSKNCQRFREELLGCFRLPINVYLYICIFVFVLIELMSCKADDKTGRRRWTDSDGVHPFRNYNAKIWKRTGWGGVIDKVYRVGVPVLRRNEASVNDNIFWHAVFKIPFQISPLSSSCISYPSYRGSFAAKHQSHVWNNDNRFYFDISEDFSL